MEKVSFRANGVEEKLRHRLGCLVDTVVVKVLDFLGTLLDEEVVLEVEAMILRDRTDRTTDLLRNVALVLLVEVMQHVCLEDDHRIAA